MTDSFADLWNAAAPTKPTQSQPQRVAQITPQPQQSRPQYDAFSILSAPTVSSTQTSRPLTSGQFSQTKTTSQHTPVSKSAISSGLGAFSDLLGSDIGSNPNVNLTIAQRAAKADKEKLTSVRGQQSSITQVSPSTWAGLDSLADLTLDSPTPHPNGPSSLRPARKSAPQTARQKTTPLVPVDDDWGLKDSVRTRTPPALAPVRSSLTQAPIPVTETKTLIWDLEDFSSGVNFASNNLINTSHAPLPTNRPGSFDFGDRNDQSINEVNSPTEDDILGDLGKPVEVIKQKQAASQSATSKVRESSPPTSIRPTSPPPHVLGQIVEMGFSIQQARIALASTESGLDVQAALDILISNGASGSRSHHSTETGDEIYVKPRSRPPPHRQATPRNGTPATRKETPEREANFQDQADKLLMQASEIGFSVLGRASAFWRDGKEKVQKVYEERIVTTKSSGSGNTNRPKWMQENESIHGDISRKGDQRGFSDDIPEQKNSKSKSTLLRSNENDSTPIEHPVQFREESTDLLSNEPAVYISPFRHAKVAPKQRSTSPTPIQLVSRANVIPAPQSSILRSAQYKAIGGEKFKLGQYAESESAYTTAISCLPDGHLLLVPLYNNRALTRLKTGNYSAAIEDTTQVTKLIGINYHPGREAQVERDEDGASVDLGDALAKAWKRRAEALEGREKWVEAAKDWESVVGAVWAKGNIRNEAIRGASRCRKMVTNTPSGSFRGEVKRVPPKPTVVRPPQQIPSATPSKAVNNLRAANEAAEAEDQARHDLKDIVDQKLLVWKGGKETNIRALLASLDAILWPELGLQKLSMADLVSPNQVKIKYTRTIAKLHPDKLSTSNTTIEQRMIANGVFGALNEAWNEFK